MARETETDSKGDMRMDTKNWDNKYEFSMVKEQNFEGEPSLSMDNSGWDSLSDVPFVGVDTGSDVTDTSWDSLSDVPFAGDVGESETGFEPLGVGDI